MEQKIKALKASSKVITIITAIGYSLMIATICICVAMLIFLGVTGGAISSFKIGTINVIIFDEQTTSAAYLWAICPVLIVMGGMFFTIFLFAYKMFNKITLTGEAFTDSNVKTIRIIGILTAAMPFIVGLTKFIAAAITKTTMPEIISDIPVIVLGAIIFCLSYIIDYGCGIRNKLGADYEVKTEK